MPLLSSFYDCGEPLQAISLNGSQEYVVVASKTHLLTYQLLPDLVSYQQFHLSNEGGGGNNFKMTDVDWNKFDNDKIAASATNGSIAVFNLNSRQSKQPKQEWESGEISRAVNRISWHAFDRYQLLSAHQDGQVKIWDTLRQKNSCLKVMVGGHGDACREAKFDPFHPHLLAAIYENGTLKVWDRRSIDHVLYRISAHAESGLTLEWSPSREGLLATGSRDKTVKIWDLNASDEVVEGERPISSSSNARPLHVIHTPAPLESISWRPSDGTNSRRQLQIATTSSNESGRGDINIWDAANPNIPACVLRGHTDGCTGFQWLDTPGSPNLFQHIISVGKDNKILVQDLRNGYFPGQHMNGHVVAVSAMGHVAFQRGSVYRGDPLGLYCNELTATAPGFFRDDPQSFGISWKSLQTDLPSQTQSLKAINTITNSPLENSPLAPSVSFPNSSPPSLAMRSFENGRVVYGMTTINSIVESIECISGYSAEGGAYDPIVIKELAQRYITSLDDREVPSTNPISSPTAIASSLSALTSRPSLGLATEHLPWGYEPVVPSFDLGFDLALPSLVSEFFPAASLPLSSSVHEAVNVCQWNCLIARSVGLAGHSMIWNALMSLIPVLVSSVDPLSTLCLGTSSTLPETSSLDYAMETLCELLIELIDSGDCQHFVICCEILRNIDDSSCSNNSQEQQQAMHDPSASHFPAHAHGPTSCTEHFIRKSLWKSLEETIGAMRIREGYVAYLELLFRLDLHQLSNSIIVRSTDKYIAQLSQQGVIIRSSCAQCCKEINLDSTGSSSSALSSSRSASIWCSKCRRCVDLCHLCQQPVKGLLHWCQICGHGGHVDCVKKWFQRFEVCPSGCGHRCLPHSLSSASSTTEAIPTPTTPSCSSGIGISTGRRR